MVECMDVNRMEEEKKTITSDLENVESPMLYSDPKELREQNVENDHVSHFGILQNLQSCKDTAPQN